MSNSSVVAVALAIVGVVVVVYLFISLFLSIYLSIYLLSISLSASLKTKLFCATSSILELDKIKNEAILRDIRQNSKVECRADGPVQTFNALCKFSTA